MVDGLSYVLCALHLQREQNGWNGFKMLMAKRRDAQTESGKHQKIKPAPSTRWLVCCPHRGSKQPVRELRAMLRYALRQLRCWPDSSCVWSQERLPAALLRCSMTSRVIYSGPHFRLPSGYKENVRSPAQSHLALARQTGWQSES